MGHLADQSADRVARQLGIRIHGQDVANVGRRKRHLAVDGDEARIRRPAQETVQFVEFAAFTLPADPLRLALIQLRLRCSSRNRAPQGAAPY